VGRILAVRQENKLELVMALLKGGADPNMKSTISGDTALHVAAQCEAIEVHIYYIALFPLRFSFPSFLWYSIC